MASEMMDDTLEDAMGDTEDESNEVVSQILDEIGIDTTARLDAAPKQRMPATVGPSSVHEDGDADLSERFSALRG
jgi:division protein CdvB (Snf7/Vps24/ESCRT-III family)